jgi:hypothetical protein
MREVGDDLLDAQRADDIDKGFEIFFSREGKQEDLSTFRFGHQPETLHMRRVRKARANHFGDNAVVRLGEQTIRIWTKTVGKELPSIRARHGSHARSHNFSICQDDFKTAMHAKMVTIWSISDTSINRVSNDRSSSYNPIRSLGKFEYPNLERRPTI